MFTLNAQYSAVILMWCYKDVGSADLKQNLKFVIPQWRIVHGAIAVCGEPQSKRKELSILFWKLIFFFFIFCNVYFWVHCFLSSFFPQWVSSLCKDLVRQLFIFALYTIFLELQMCNTLKCRQITIDVVDEILEWNNIRIITTIECRCVIQNMYVSSVGISWMCDSSLAALAFFVLGISFCHPIERESKRTKEQLQKWSYK